MSNIQYKQITRIAILLAITLICQSLRFFIPLPPIASTFLIGSLVNFCLISSVIKVNLKAGMIISTIAPIFAYLQGLLFIPHFILPIIIANIIYILIFHLIYLKQNIFFTSFFASISKSIFLYLTIFYLLKFLNIPEKVAFSLLFVMSWPQFITAFIGIISAHILSKRLP